MYKWYCLLPYRDVRLAGCELKRIGNHAARETVNSDQLETESITLCNRGAGEHNDQKDVGCTVTLAGSRDGATKRWVVQLQISAGQAPRVLPRY
ncbi:MAG: hypothetical protein P8L39_17860 [Halioglobus sp.]|nr:hypothetical protein [Halioglobus sp.]